ncbi:hypothetical protein BC829DRAFT_396983 [Chytridium lagenaria]|nr:hypothetical protein BC829DRAFT_396983 [Chytridium lagenaria]
MIDLTPHMDNALSRKAATLVTTVKQLSHTNPNLVENLSEAMETVSLKSAPAEVRRHKKKKLVTRTKPAPTVIIPNTPSTCPCEEVHQKMTSVFTGTFKASVDRLWDLLYVTPMTPDSFFHNFITKRRKCQNLVLTDWLPGTKSTESPKTDSSADAIVGSLCSAGHPSPPSLTPPVKYKNLGMAVVGSHRHMEYVIPLNNPLGPKSTRCQAREFIEHVEEVLEGGSVGYVCVKQTSVTPDVPAGNTFLTHLKICLTRVSATETRLKASCDVEFTKSSWIQSVLKSAVPDGMRTYYRELEPFLSDYLFSNPPSIPTVQVMEEIEVTDDEEQERNQKSEASIKEYKADSRAPSLEHPLQKEVEEIRKLENEEKRRRSPQRGVSPVPPGIASGLLATADTASVSLTSTKGADGLDHVAAALDNHVVSLSAGFTIFYAIVSRLGSPVTRSEKFKASFAVVLDGLFQSPRFLGSAMLLFVLGTICVMFTMSQILSSFTDRRLHWDQAIISQIVEETVRKTLHILEGRSQEE